MTGLFSFKAPLKRNTRRGLIILSLIMLVGYIGLALYGYRFVWEGFLLLFLYWVFVLRLARSTSLFMSTNLLFVSKKNQSLDERQQSLRSRAYHLAYLVAAPLAVLIGLIDFVGFGDALHFYNSLGLTSILIYANMCLVISLPTIYVAWLEPDSIAEDLDFTTRQTLKGDPS